MAPLRWLQQLLDVALPNICPGCTQHRPPRGQWLCLSCEARLPLTDFHRFSENRVTDRLWGRIPLEAATAMLLFRKDGIAQNLIHHLKYKGRQDVGYQLGKRYGYLLRQQAPYHTVDAIVPVPLHLRKLQMRGYNQAAIFGQGLATTMHVPVIANALQRTRFTQTQTRKSLDERIRNVTGAFSLNQSQELQGKHLLLVDDVLTTGATLESCAQLLLSVADVRLSVATLAIAY